RTSMGDWIVGFTHNIGRCSIEEAELWAVYKGLQVAWETGLKKIQLEVDSETVIK
ncbi:ribonuclease H protein-like, partial [Dorcoceras hygrometricum]